METWAAAVPSRDGAPQLCAPGPCTWHRAGPWGLCCWGSTQAEGPQGSCCPCLPPVGRSCLLPSAQQGRVGQGRPGAWAGGRLSVVRCAVAAVPWTGGCPSCCQQRACGPVVQPHPCVRTAVPCQLGEVPASGSPRTCSYHTRWGWRGRSRCCCVGLGPGSPQPPAPCFSVHSGQVLLSASSSWSLRCRR